MTLSVLVIGGGITGISTAEYLRREGIKVKLIDKVFPGNPFQTSYGNAGLLASSSIIPIASPELIKKLPYYLFNSQSPFSIKWSYLPKLIPWIIPFLKNTKKEKFLQTVNAIQELTRDSVDQHLTLAKGTPAEKFIRLGDFTLLYPSKNDLSYDDYENNLRIKYGFKMKTIDRKELLEKDPFLGEKYQYGVVFKEHGWITSPSNYMKSLAHYFQLNGGKILLDEVKEINANSVQTVKNHSYTADKIIICAGAWSGKLMKTIKHKTNLETERGYHLYLKGVNFMPKNPYAVSDLKFAITPMTDGLRCAGTTELGGLNAKPSLKRFDLLRSAIKTVYPEIKWDKEECWMGHRPTTPDCLPVLGQSDEMKHVYFAFGGQHIGLTIGPRVGRLMTDLILNRKTNFSLEPYKYNRF